MNDSALGRWPLTIDVPVAWGDMDAFRHVNNTVYLRWFETARIAYFERVGLIELQEREGIGPILARQTIDYRRPLTYPDRVRVATTVTRLGTTSFVMGFRITGERQPDAVAAEGDGVVVLIDYRRGEKVPLSETLRGAIVSLEASGA